MVKRPTIKIEGAKENNLQNITVEIPKDTFVCVTGISGSGKSSLIYDTIYAESRRLLFETMSINTFGQQLMDKPNVENISNLPPAVSLAQNTYNKNPRSTIGTLTDCSHHLRNIFSLFTNGKYKANDFSSTNPLRWCRECEGTGEQYFISKKLVLPDSSKNLSDGAISFYSGSENSYEMALLTAYCSDKQIDMLLPFNELSSEIQEELLYTSGVHSYEIKYKNIKGRKRKEVVNFKGAITYLEEELMHIKQPSVFVRIQKYLEQGKCCACQGNKLSDEMLSIKIENQNISEVEKLSIEECVRWLLDVEREASFKGNNYLPKMTEALRKRLQSLIDLKVGYLSLERSVPTLSGGELQRVRIATHLSSSLTGLLYILDEPCRGLHPRNINEIVNATQNLIKKGNSLIAIEHNKKYLAQGDYLIELGPGSGPEGGKIISEGKIKANSFITHAEFKSTIETPKDYLKFENISYRTLIQQNLEFPLKQIIFLTGVSGSGKSSLAQVIASSIQTREPQECKKILNLEKIKTLVSIDQSPIGRNPRSTVISYLGIYDVIRELFSSVPEAKSKKIPSSYFSMNTSGGRCEECQGTGRKKIELQNLPDIFVKCEECSGKRFSPNILEIKWNDLTIDDILSTAIEEIVKKFNEIPSVEGMLDCIIKLGVGHLSLGQMSMHLSGGESQRLKLAKYLGKKMKSNQLFILDEPTNGLSDSDILRLESVLQSLRDKGNTLLIIEHNLDFVKRNADYLIDMGCEGGQKGGHIVFQGLPRDVQKVEQASWYGIT